VLQLLPRSRKNQQQPLFNDVSNVPQGFSEAMKRVSLEQTPKPHPSLACANSIDTSPSQSVIESFLNDNWVQVGQLCGVEMLLWYI
jgi:hypothetical protein